MSSNIEQKDVTSQKHSRVFMYWKNISALVRAQQEVKPHIRLEKLCSRESVEDFVSVLFCAEAPRSSSLRCVVPICRARARLAAPLAAPSEDEENSLCGQRVHQVNDCCLCPAPLSQHSAVTSQNRWTYFTSVIRAFCGGGGKLGVRPCQFVRPVQPGGAYEVEGS